MKKMRNYLLTLSFSLIALPVFGQSKLMGGKEMDKVVMQSEKGAENVQVSLSRRASTGYWYSLGFATFIDNFLCEREYQVELQQYLLNPSLFRLVQPYFQAFTAEGWNSNGIPAADLQFRVMKKGEMFEVYKDTAWVSEPLVHDSLVYFYKRCTGWYGEWETVSDTIADNIYISHPGYWTRWGEQDSILHNRVLSYQESGYPAVVQLAPYYYVNNLGGWNYTQRDSVVLIKFPTISLSNLEQQIISVTQNSSSRIDDANYTGTLEDGTILGFYLNTNNSYVYFCGAITSATSIVVPEKVSYNGKVYDVLYFGYDSGYEIDFDEAPNVNSLTLPSVLTYIYNYVPSSVSELHLLGTTPPSINSSGYISLSTTVYVPKSAYGTYQSYCNNCNNGWSTSIDLRVEGWVPQSYTVTVNTPGTFGNILLATVEQWTNVEELTVIGHLNTDDLKMLARLQKVRKIDLSQTDITVMIGCSGLTKLKNVLLPSTVTEIGNNAFRYCTNLNSINTENVVSVGSYAFIGCSALTTIYLPLATEIGSFAFKESGLSHISLPLVKTIGDGAFQDSQYLENINIPMVEILGSGSSSSSYFGESTIFGGTGITTIELPKVKFLKEGCFYNCSKLDNVYFSEGLESIPNYCFYCCDRLSYVIFPSTLKVIGSHAFAKWNSSYHSYFIAKFPEGLQFIYSNAFSNCKLKTISIPSTIQDINDYAFENCSEVTDVYCYAIVPPNTSAFMEMTGATLHVPTFSLTSYMLNDNWYNFNQIVPIEGNLSNLTINQAFTINTYEGLEDKVDLNLTRTGHLTVSAGDTFNLGTFTQVHYHYYGGCSSLISNNEIKADNVNLCLEVQTNRWNFISFPFDVNVSDIEVPEGTLWVIRKYSGADRAALTGNTWQNMTNGTVLQAGEGYILHCANENTSTVEFVFHPVNNAKKNGLFAYQDVVKPLATYASEHAHNRSWNLVGNPYPAYFDTRCIEHNGVITVYNGNSYNSSYTAYSLLDDDYVLRPHEAFFVQCPMDATSMTFKAEGRQHEYKSSNQEDDYYYTRVPALKAPSNSNRKVYNFTLSSGDFTDRARLVINPDARVDYEISCDASKFMSDDTEVPQLYVLDNGVRFAIDERPLGNGNFVLGTRFGQMGEYTIALKHNPTEDMSVVLTDNETGRQVNLGEESYTFTAQAGSSESRFTLTIGCDATSVDGIATSPSTNRPSIYDLQGRRVNADAKGIYIIQQNGKSRKVVK